MRGIKIFAIIFMVVIILLGTTIFGVLGGWFDTWFTNKVNFVNQKIDDKTRYETIKKVEDTCRSMIASYKTDKATYEMYKNSENEEKQSWAEQAKMRANKTANTYNEYVLKNSFVFEDNIPADIDNKLMIIE